MLDTAATTWRYGIMAYLCTARKKRSLRESGFHAPQVFGGSCSSLEKTDKRAARRRDASKGRGLEEVC